MVKTIVNVSPKVLNWILESSGYTSEELSKKIGSKTNIYQQWIEEKSQPTFKQLEKISSIIKRPVGVFFYLSPPQEKPLPKDYRMFIKNKNKFDKKTLLVIRKARGLQESINELSNNLNEDVIRKIKKHSIDENVEEVAMIYRKKLDLPIDSQVKFKNYYDYYNYLRKKFEEINIFTFQMAMPLEDARGFALSDTNPSIIVVNSRDMVEARIFTLMHEFGHILLGETGIDLLELRNKDRIEKWCNSFAGNILLPKEYAKKLFDENKNTLTTQTTLKTLSKKNKVSKAMLLYRMVELGYISWIKFDELTKYENIAPDQKGRGIPVENKILNEVGGKFVGLVSGNLDKKNITYSDALGYLSIKAKKFDKLLTKAKT